MATVEHTRTNAISAVPASVSLAPARQAYLILYAGFVLLPVLAGMDKFFNLLVDWSIYVPPVISQILPFGVGTFLMIVGVIEVAAGLLVLYRPQIGAYVVAVWLLAIIANLLLIPGFYDVAARDFGLSLGALALARLSREFA